MLCCLDSAAPDRSSSPCGTTAKPAKKKKRRAFCSLSFSSAPALSNSICGLEQHISKVEDKLDQLTPQMLTITSKLASLKDSLARLKCKAFHLRERK
ncbi:hypothetical protein EB796_005840 [Bugula neritina]|uniref:Uncharacterized protein n=1 Tax=Bugula neritina TaxID=10212 RepID=A0A7J7KCB9_BUGNE|nr:hypothetical protein EB796_005840 [Bugula neritina]